MASHALRGRAGLDLVFGAFLVNGLLICAAVVVAIAGFTGRARESGMLAFAIGISAALPTIAAWVLSVIRSFAGPRDSDVRLGAALATIHLLLWIALIALGAFGPISNPPGWLLATPVLGTVCYGLAVTWLALRWFFVRRHRSAHASA